MSEVILVDENDKKVGTEEKIRVHKEGKLHRAFSIFVFNSEGKLLLQKRAKSKYHSGGLWSNTCCSHPKPNESLEKAIHKRLKTEMGFDCELEEIFNFIYSAEFENGLSESEYDHVFKGEFNGKPDPNPNEAEDWKWISLEELKKDMERNPDKYTYWFRASIDRVISYVEQLPGS